MSNDGRLKRLRKAIDEEPPVDGVHNGTVEELYEDGGECPRYLGCTSEGSGESGYRHNPDFFAGRVERMDAWLTDSYREGWAARWVLDLDTGEGVGWKTAVRLELPETEDAPDGLERAETALTQCQHIAHDGLTEIERSGAIDRLRTAIAMLERIQSIAEGGEAEESFRAMLDKARAE